jgi:transcriptional regulator with XRE-family HTH domain
MSLKLFAKNLRHRRMALGYTQQNVADMLNLGYSGEKVFQHWEKGRNWPGSHDLLIKVCDILNVDSIDKFIRTDMTKNIKYKVCHKKQKSLQ